MDIGWGYYRGELVTDSLEVYNLRRQHRTAVVLKRWEEDKRLLAEMESLLDMSYVENRQYIEGKRNMVEFELGNLSAEEAYWKDKELLKLTMKREVTEVEFYCYSQMELELLAHMAVMLNCQKKHKMGIQLLERLLEKIQNSNVDMIFWWNGIACVVRALSDLYFEDGQYEKSYRLAKYDYQMNLSMYEARALSWNLGTMADDLEYLDKRYRDKCKKLYKQAVYISDFWELHNESNK